MKTPRHSWTGVLVVLAAGMVAGSSAGGGDAARAAIESQSLALMQASKRGDAAGMAAVFTTDARIKLPGPQGAIAGRAAVQRFWESALNGGMQELSLAAVELEGDGELRFETGAFSARGSNGAMLGAGEYLLVWKKEGGAWRIYRDYGRPAAPAASSAAPRVVPSGDRSGFPANYLSFAALGTAFNERSSEVTTTFVDPTAAGIERAGQLPYPDGTVFVMEFASARRDGEAQLLRDSAGQVLKGEILHVDVMRKRGAGERAGPGVSAWEFVSYRSDGSVAIAPADAAHCADCHRNAGEEKDFVFRTRAPLAR